jgi:hypothetical protein
MATSGRPQTYPGLLIPPIGSTLYKLWLTHRDAPATPRIRIFGQELPAVALLHKAMAQATPQLSPFHQQHAADRTIRW